MMDSDQDIYEYEENEAEIDLTKIYSFPKELVIKEYKGVYLVIYTEGILWLVLSDDKEFEAFQREANSKYEDFRDECNAQYAKFLAESWKSFKALAPVERPKEQKNLPESVLKMMQF